MKSKPQSYLYSDIMKYQERRIFTSHLTAPKQGSVVRIPMSRMKLHGCPNQWTLHNYIQVDMCF